MENIKNIDGIHLYLCEDKQQMYRILDDIQSNSRNVLAIFPDPDDQDHFLGYMLLKYYNHVLEKWFSVDGSREQGQFQILSIRRCSMRSYITFLGRRLFPPQAHVAEDTANQTESNSSAFDWLTNAEIIDLDEEESSAPAEPQDDPITAFLKSTTPMQMEQALNKHVIGQPDLTKAVADFLYYHALRQLHPDLPQRPLLIAGPSGSGKTEVWRVASKLYGHLFPIKVIDGSNMSCEGWAGNYKIDTYLNPAFAQGGILIVDEFDKLAKPRYTSAGENVSHEIQAEFLKLVEGEYHITERKKQTNTTTKMMGFVLVGAFETLWMQKEQPKTAPQIGFCFGAPQAAAEPAPTVLTDEDFIAYGILPELIGRVAVKCATKPLDDEAYWDIIRGPHSRVAAIEQVLKQYGTQVTDVISHEELRQMVATSKSNRTGVRWVSAQVENRLLEAIHEHGLFPGHAA